jgi:hypothetical protein
MKQASKLAGAVPIVTRIAARIAEQRSADVDAIALETMLV